MGIDNTQTTSLTQSNKYLQYLIAYDYFVQEMMLLHEVDKPGSDIEEYVSSLDAILYHKMELISVIRQRLLDFYSHLKMEENLQKLYQTKQTVQDDPNLMDQLDDFDQNMMDEANVNINEGYRR